MNYRNNGAIGALLDEYEKALKELVELIQSIPDEQLLKQMDYETKDMDCISIQTILTHVVRAGYGYVFEIRKYLGEDNPAPKSNSLVNAEKYKEALYKMFEANVRLFEDYPNIQLNEFEASKKMKVRWGDHYDVEQLMEHAIVHILRHRRQIERFLLKLNAA